MYAKGINKLYQLLAHHLKYLDTDKYYGNTLLLVSWTLSYLRHCIVAMGSQAFRLTFNRSPLDMHIVPSLPPTQ